MAIRNAKTKSELSTDTVKALEMTIIALQAEVKTLKSNRATPNPNKAHLKCTNSQGQYPPWWKGKHTQTPSVPSANLATSYIAAGDVMTGGHYALSASFDMKHIENIIAQNVPVERKVSLAVAENPGALSMGTTVCVADLGCTTYFFKSCDTFSAYTPLEKAAGQSSKEGTNFTVIGMGTVQMKVVHKGLDCSYSLIALKPRRYCLMALHIWPLWYRPNC